MLLYQHASLHCVTQILACFIETYCKVILEQHTAVVVKVTFYNSCVVDPGDCILGSYLFFHKINIAFPFLLASKPNEIAAGI